MLKVSILKVENPSCLWGRVVSLETSQQYDNLLAQMNLFYHDVTQDLSKMKPSSLKEGQVCVLYWSVMKLWCRAVVESIFTDSVSCQARCLLVDHGERLVVSSDQIRIAVPDFLQLPFWVRRFHLARIKPATLRVTVFEEQAKLVPASHWDSSASLYLHNLLQASTWTEAVLLESEADSTSIELYLTVGNVKICVNDDLVGKKFAFYIRGSADGVQQDEVDQHPLMLSSNILNQFSPSRTVSNAADKTTEQTQTSPVTSRVVPAGGADDFQKAPSSPQRQHEQTYEDRRLQDSEGQLSSGGQSQSSSDAAAADSDSSEETDSSLAAALTKNLSLFRFLKFLNPLGYQQAAPTVSQQEEELGDFQHEATTSIICTEQGVQACMAASTPQSRQTETQHEEASLSLSGQNGAEGVTESQQVHYFAKKRSEECAAAEKTWSSTEDGICSRLLEWLNPGPLNFDKDAEDKEVVQFDPRRSGMLVHSALPVDPCSSLDDAPITDNLRRVLQRKQYTSLSSADRYSWPAVARGCNTFIMSSNADQPFSYLAPLLTHILLNSVFTSLTSSAGPIAVLLCSGWEKVQAVFDLLDEMKVAQILHPVPVLLGVGKDEAKTFKIPKNCLLLVTTPFSLVRLLSCHCFLFLRMYHLVLDEADQLFTRAPEQMATILQHFQKVTSSEQKTSCPQQLVAVAKRWTSPMESLLVNHMPHPCIVIAVMEEASLYGNVQQIVLMAPETSKISVLLSTLDYNPDVGQKTLIITNSAQEVEDVFKAVTNKSAFCLMTHQGLAHQFDFVVQQWRKDIGPGTNVVLVTTNECLRCLGIRDATCVVHYSFPTSPKLFGGRLFCMAENFRNLSERSESAPPVTRSVLLISERNARHAVGVLRYLVRTNAPLPPELLSFAEGVHVAREDQKTNRPLCRNIKSFGVCRDSGVCPDRHRFIPQLDQSPLPASGVIEVLPLYVKTASVFYGCIIKKEEGGFQSLLSEMTSYYADKKPGAKDLLEGNLYAVQVDEVFYRVKILSVPEKEDRLFFSVLVRFIDAGKEENVKSHQILQLPEQFQSLPGQAVEMVLCRVKPVDEETDWHPKVTRAISQKIRGQRHRARIVFSLGNTIFVDPVVRVTQIPGMKTVINEYNVQSEILKTGMGISNPDHLDLLKALCQESKTYSCQEEGETFRSEDGPVSLEVRIKAQEEVLAKAFRAAEVIRLAEPPELEPCEPPHPESAEVPALVPAPPEPQKGPPAEPYLVPVCDQSLLSPALLNDEQRDSFSPDLKLSEQMMRIRDERELCLSSSQAVHHNADGPAVDNQQAVVHNEADADVSTKSFHPQVCWYQTTDSVIVTVKLTSPENQRCDFHSNRVVYSGLVNGRIYRADLELYASISADLCCWEVKSNKPVLKLVKQQKRFWEKLLKDKNIFVSYDMDHFEEEEDKLPNGLRLEGNTGEDDCYGNSEGERDSDSDSD